MCVLIIMAAATTAQAGISVFAGATLPSGEAFDAITKPGGHLGLELTLPVIPSFISVGGQASLSRNTWEDPWGDTAFYTGEALAIGKVYLPMTGLFGKVGLGFNRYSVTSDDEIEYESSTHLAGAIGAGISFTGLELNAMYHLVKWDDDAENPGSIEDLENMDDNYSYFTVSAAFGF